MADNINAKIHVDERLAEIVQSVEKLVTGLDKFITTTEHVKKSTHRAAKAQENIAAATKKAANAMEVFNKGSQDLTKSVQVALGPLSGVAARITAMTALFNRNSFAAASLIGFMTGLGVATKKLTRFAMETEIELLRMEAVVASLGETANFTANELEYMAQSLTQATLASVSEAREAVTTLATFGNIAPEAFQKATQAAYAFADVMGGQLAASVRQVGVLLEDPVRNMEMLRRRGIQFTQAERNKIDVLMKSGKVMEAQNLTLEKFNVFMEQSEAKAKLLAGSLDRTAQLFNNFAQAVANAGNLTGGVATQVGQLNIALEKLLKNEAFIQTWGSVFAGIANAISGALQKLANNIEIVTVALLALLQIIAIRTIIALSGFAAKLAGLTPVLGGAVTMLISARTALLVMVPALAKVGGLVAALTGPLGVFVLSVGAAIAIFRRWRNNLKEAEERIAPLMAELDLLNEKIKDLPDHVRIGFEIDSQRLVREIDAAKVKVAELHLSAAQANREMSRGLVSRSFLAGTREMSEEEWEQRRKIVAEYEEQKRLVQELESALGKLHREAEMGAQAGRLFGTPNIEAAINNLRALEESLDAGVAADRRRTESLTILWNILESIAMQTPVGMAFMQAGYTEEEVAKLIDLVNRGTTTTEKANDSWKNLANTFADVQFNIDQLVREFDGLDNSMQIPPSLMRQWEALTSGERSKLTGMGVTPETLTAEQNIEKQINDLLKYRDNILASQLTEYEKIAQEAERMLGILEQTDRLTENVKNQVRDQIDSYIELKAIEPFKDLEKQVNEQQQLNVALRQGETEYNRIRREIEVLNKVEEYRLRLTQLDVKNIEERVAAFEEQLRVMALLRAEYDELNANLQKYKAFAQDLGSVISNSFEEAIVSGNRLRDVLQGLLDDILRIATRVMITKPLENALVGALTGMSGNLSGISGVTRGSQQDLMLAAQTHGLAKGGIMTSGGPVPLKSYARGGIATSPQLAMFGEGSQAEAYVPLPDGKRIPVAMQGASNVNISIINNVGAEITTTRTSTPQGESIEVMIDRAVASKLAERGSDSNRSLRSAFNMRPTLAGR